MGWDVTYHPISSEEMQECYFDVLTKESQIDSLAQKYSIEEPFVSRYHQIIDIARKVDATETFNSTHGFYLAIIQGFIREYFYIRGALFSSLVQSQPVFERYITPWNILIPQSMPPQKILQFISHNYSCGVYISAENVRKLLNDYTVSPNVTKSIDDFYSHKRNEVFLKAVRYAADRNLGLLEATDVVVPDPMDLVNGTKTHSNLLHCDPDGAFLYHEAAMKQLKELMERKNENKAVTTAANSQTMNAGQTTYLQRIEGSGALEINLSQVTKETLPQWIQTLHGFIENREYEKALVLSRHILLNVDHVNMMALKTFFVANEESSTTVQINPGNFAVTAAIYYPHEAWALEALAQYLFRCGGESYLESKRVFDKCISLDKSNKKYPRVLGEIYLINQDPPSAEEYLKKAWDLDPTNMEYMTRYSIALVRLHRTHEAVKLIDEAIRSGSDDKDVWDNIGMVLLLVGELSEAKKYFQKACDALPEYGYFQNHLRMVERELVDFENRKSTGQRYTPLFIRQKSHNKWFDGNSSVNGGSEESVQLEVDVSLTPENCDERGYEWEVDTIYDPSGPRIVNMEIKNMIDKGWKLGEPGNIHFRQNDGVGLYRPKGE